MKEMFLSNNPEHKSNKLVLDLQHFADDPGNDGNPAGGEPGTEGAGGTGGTGDPDTKTPGNEPKTFTQDQVNKMMQDRLARERKAWDKKLEEHQNEAKKLAKMNADEKKKYEEQKRLDDLAKREAEITKRELTATAKESLIELGLPAELSEILDYSDAEACKASIDSVSKAFKEAVDKTIESKLKGGKPPKKAVNQGKVTEEQFKKMGYKDRVNLYNTDKELYDSLSKK